MSNRSTYWCANPGLGNKDSRDIFSWGGIGPDSPTKSAAKKAKGLEKLRRSGSCTRSTSLDTWKKILPPGNITWDSGSLPPRARRWRGENLIQVARPHLKKVTGRVRDENHQSCRAAKGDEIVYLEILESPHPFRMTDTIGARIPWHSTALGKSIAAFLA